MASFRQKLLESPVRYRCIVCGERLKEFHLCWSCFQPVHPGCSCHPVAARQDDRMNSFNTNLRVGPQYGTEG